MAWEGVGDAHENAQKAPRLEDNADVRKLRMRIELLTVKPQSSSQKSKVG